MKKLWQKKNEMLDPAIEAFETKGDLSLDQKLIKYDVVGSLAHAKMLNKIGILNKGELKILEKGLSEILDLDKKGKFILELGDEDMHTKIENYLTEKYGEVGQKIHTGRSRNDQVLTAVRLYSKDQLADIEKETKILIKTFKSFFKKYGSIKMPGYTHMQKAMPSSVGMWADSFVDSLEDDLLMLESVFKLIDQSPLGSGAGYGVPLKLDKKYTAKLLNFSKVQNNPIYVQNSKGKFDGVILGALIQILLTINKFASDLMLFTTSEFNYFNLTDKVTTGSSIMPQKKNLDAAELLRAKVHVVLGNLTSVISMSTNLISGYNRDLQDVKKPLVESLEITVESIKVTVILLNNLTPNIKVLQAGLTKEVFTAEKTLNKVKKGMPFREAYKTVAHDILRN